MELYCFSYFVGEFRMRVMLNCLERVAISDLLSVSNADAVYVSILSSWHDLLSSQFYWFQ